MPVAADPSFVVLIADTPGAVGALQTYLQREGVRAEVTQGALQTNAVPARATGLVWFVDSLPMMSVVSAVDRLRLQRPGLRMVLITSMPEKVTGLLRQVTGRVAPTVLPQGATSSEILGVLRDSACGGAR